MWNPFKRDNVIRIEIIPLDSPVGIEWTPEELVKQEQQFSEEMAALDADYQQHLAELERIRNGFYDSD